MGEAGTHQRKEKGLRRTRGGGGGRTGRSVKALQLAILVMLRKGNNWGEERAEENFVPKRKGLLEYAQFWFR